MRNKRLYVFELVLSKTHAFISDCDKLVIKSIKTTSITYIPNNNNNITMIAVSIVPIFFTNQLLPV